MAERAAFLKRWLADPELVAAHPDEAERFAAVAVRYDELAKFNPSQPRDPDGRFASGGGAIGLELNDNQLDALAPKLDRINSSLHRTRAQNAIADWTAGAENSEEINQSLRSGGPMDWATGPAQRQIRGLNDAFQYGSTRLDQDILVYRAIGDTGFPLTPGTTYIDRGFVSTTASPGIGNDITSQIGGRLFQVVVPRGTAVLAPDGRRDPKEVLLNRGTKFKIVSQDRIEVVP